MGSDDVEVLDIKEIHEVDENTPINIGDLDDADACAEAIEVDDFDMDDEHEVTLLVDDQEGPLPQETTRPDDLLKTTPSEETTPTTAQPQPSTPPEAAQASHDSAATEPAAPPQAPTSPQDPSEPCEDTASQHVDDAEADGVEFIEIDDDMPDPQQAEMDTMQARIVALEEELRATQQRLLRVAAEFENFKRRAERDKEDLKRFGNEKLIVDFLPVQDNLERAILHAATSDDRQSLLQGVQMVQRQFVATLGKHQCNGFDSLGASFDPQRHEAIHQIEKPDLPANTILEEYQRGYFLNDRLIRPALVVVSKLPSGQSEPLTPEQTVADDTAIAVDSSGEAREVSSNENPAE